MVGFPRLSIVREDGRELTSRHITIKGGSGIRIYPRQLMEPLGYRPADEYKHRACDTSILSNLERHWTGRMRVMHQHLHDHQIVDWKSPTEQLNGYAEIASVYRAAVTADPFEVLAEHYPEALAEMRALYASRELVAA
jgi:hypothetical protein